MPREALLARTLVELADSLVKDFDVVELLTLLVDRSLEVIEVAAVGLTLASADGALRVLAASSEAMHLLELFETECDEGPPAGARGPAASGRDDAGPVDGLG